MYINVRLVARLAKQSSEVVVVDRGLGRQDRSLASRCSFALLDLCASSLRRGHADILGIVPILADDPRRESVHWL